MMVVKELPKSCVFGSRKHSVEVMGRERLAIVRLSA
jgi:hypothetical protein